MLGVAVIGSAPQLTVDPEAERFQRLSQPFGYGPSGEAEAERVVRLSSAWGYDVQHAHAFALDREAERSQTLSRAFGYGHFGDAEAERLFRLSRACGYGAQEAARAQQQRPSARTLLSITVAIGLLIAAIGTVFALGWVGEW